jgi:hypothetical protein
MPNSKGRIGLKRRNALSSQSEFEQRRSQAGGGRLQAAMDAGFYTLIP